VLESISRLERELTAPDRQAFAAQARELLAAYRKNRDLISIGAYVSGTNPQVDRAIRAQPELNKFLRQPVSESRPCAESWDLLQAALSAATIKPSK